jgi:hypothetical protein
VLLPLSMDIEGSRIPVNADTSMDVTFCGTMIDFNEVE